MKEIPIYFSRLEDSISIGLALDRVRLQMVIGLRSYSISSSSLFFSRMDMRFYHISSSQLPIILILEIPK